VSQKIRVGIIGAGGIAQIMHMPYLLDTPAFEMVALADTNADVLAAVAERYHLQRTYLSWQDLLKDSDIDAVLICHGGSHRDSVLGALDAGKHVFVEKPLAWNRRECVEIAERAAKSGRIVQVGYHKLYDPAFRYGKEELSKFEDLAFVECTVLHAADEFNRAPYQVLMGKENFSQFNYEMDAWENLQKGALEGLSSGEIGRLASEALGDLKTNDSLQVAFGLLTISVIHQIYTLFGFLGEATRVINANFWRGGQSMQIFMEFPNDVHCTLNWHNLPYLNDYRETYSFYGNKRRMRLEFPGPYYRNFPTPVVLQGGEGELSWEKRVTVSFREAFHNELLAFADSIQTGKTPISTADDAVKHADFIEQIVRAAR
jgi:predicted dehydrogenase